MAQLIQGYSVSSSNGSRSQKPSVTVKNDKGQICARIHSDKGRILERVRRWIRSPERQELMNQLLESGVPPNVISEILSPQQK